MKRPEYEVADVFRQFASAYIDKYWPIGRQQSKVLRAIQQCRTTVLGGHVDKCDSCGHQDISYNSCRNRCCPKCQHLEKDKWLQARQQEVLPINYFHAVFTIPSQLRDIALRNQRVVYGLLFRAVSQTLLRLGADPKHLGAKIGFITVLHTWGENLMHHPHIHCIVTGGGLAADKGNLRWIHSRSNYLFPGKVISKYYREVFLDLITRAFRKGELTFVGKIEHLGQPKRFGELVKSCREHDWVVDVQPARGGPQKVLEYLSRYTYRVAISNHRIVSIANGRVCFTCKNYRKNGQRETLSLDGVEFMRRFMMHVLPKGFIRIRSYGLLASCKKVVNLKICRSLLGVTDTPVEITTEQEIDPLLKVPFCPKCHKGRMICQRTWEARAPPYRGVA